MKIIIPVAGRGTRVQPHSYSKPKPMIRVAGKRAIDFLIEQMLPLNPEECIIVTDPRNDKSFKEYLPKRFPDIKFNFAIQEKQIGTAHVIYMAEKFVQPNEEIFILFCDTILHHNLSRIGELKQFNDGVMLVKEVEDYKRFGVVLHNNRIMTGIIEKPDEPISKLANIGAYYIKDGYSFIQNYVKKIIDEDIRVKGELFLTEAFSMMIKDGKKIYVEDVDLWLDVGKIETVLETNAALLKGGVFRGENVVIENSTIRENVSIAENTKVIGCNIENSIIGANTHLEGLTIKDSIIGDHVILKRDGTTYNIGDKCSIN